MSDRAKDGYTLYKSGAVEIIDADEANGVYLFEVTGSKGDIYQVTNMEGDWLCMCDDKQFRGKHAEGAFNCKHIAACFYKLRELWDASEETVKVEDCNPLNNPQVSTIIAGLKWRFATQAGLNMPLPTLKGVFPLQTSPFPENKGFITAKEVKVKESEAVFGGVHITAYKKVAAVEFLNCMDVHPDCCDTDYSIAGKQHKSGHKLLNKETVLRDLKAFGV